MPTQSIPGDVPPPAEFTTTDESDDLPF
jgi:hypothetical protein